MRVISKTPLVEFWTKHPAAKESIDVWYKLVRGKVFVDLTDLKRTFRSVDYVPKFTVFDVGGNNVRVITVIHYNRQRLYVRHVFTHPEYDRWSKPYRSGKI